MLAASALVRVAAPAMTPGSALQRQRSLGRTLNCPAPAIRAQLIGGGLRPTRRVAERRAAQPPTAQRREGGVSASRAVSAELVRPRAALLAAFLGCHSRCSGPEAALLPTAGALVQHLQGTLRDGFLEPSPRRPPCLPSLNAA